MRLRFIFPFGIVLLLLVVFPVADCVEAPGIAWSKTYGGKHSESAYAMVETSDGGFAIAGWFTHFIFVDSWLVKTDAYGNMLWNRTYIGFGAYALIETSDGGFALTGTGSRLVKTDAYGNVEWNCTYGKAEYCALAETSDGGFAIAGTTESGVALDFCLVKTEPAISPLIISIVSPENRTYTANSVPLTFTVNKPAKWMAYSLDGKANVTIDGNTTLNELPNGSHNITIYATDLEGNTAASKTIYFTVDAQGPSQPC
jgi:hypothetical protein